MGCADASYDQFLVILEVLGTPNAADIARIRRRSSEAADFLSPLPVQDGVDLQARLPSIPSEYIELLRRMLAFWPEDRISAEDALKHSIFRDSPTEEDEVRAKIFAFMHIFL